MLINGKNIASLTINGRPVAALTINGKTAYGGGGGVTGAIAFTSLQDDSTIKIAHHGTGECDVNLEYRIDDDWQPYTPGTLLNIAKGWTIYFRNTTGAFSVDDANWLSIIAKGAWDVAGELNALLDYRVQADAVPEYAFYRLFCDDETHTACDIVDAGRLKIQFDTVNAYGLASLFSECATLVKPPKKIDVKTVGQSACASMFYGCSRLTQAPELPATNIATRCYDSMFGNSGLVKAPELPATAIAQYCYTAMF